MEIVKQRILTIVAAIMIAAVESHALTATVNGITWTYTVSDGNASVGGGSSSSPAVPKATSGAITIPSTLGGYPVTTIGSFAFYYCKNITSVTIPNSVTSIGDYAFYNCSGLTSVTIPNTVTSIGVNAFYNCSSLTSVHISDLGAWCGISFNSPGFSAHNLILSGRKVTDLVIPSSVTSIGDDAFYNCSGLTSVTIPNTVTSIGDDAFYNCSGLTSVTIPNSVTNIGSSAFQGCSGLTSVAIPNSVTSIGSSAFQGCSGLTSVTIPNSVTNIWGGAFHGCSGLTSVTIPEYVTCIWDGAFCNCSGLTSVTIPNSVTNIRSQAFYGCSGLRSVTIPASVTSIGDYAFYGCSGLSSVTIPNSVTRIGAYPFSGSGIKSIVMPGRFSISSLFEYPYSSITNAVITEGSVSIGGSAFKDCSNLMSVTIPNSVTSIERYAFYGCSGLNSVAIPNSVTSIESYAFYSCSGLNSVTIPNSVTSIGASAFRECASLTFITIPASVTSISASAFSGCSGLTSVTIDNGVTSIGAYAFYGCTGITSVTIPDSVTNIANSAFAGNCFNISSVVVPGWFKMSVVFPNAYQYSITSVIVGEGSSSIVASAFSDCRNLTSVTIPNSVTSIGNDAFYGCSGLRSVTIPGQFTMSSVFPSSYRSITNAVISEGSASIANSAFSGCALKSVTIPNSVTSIGNDAFYGCSGLTSVIIPNSATSIGNDAFYGCSGLRSVTIPGQFTMSSVFPSSYRSITNAVVSGGSANLANSAFSGCDGLTSVTIPASVTSIGDNAFNSCSCLTSVTIPNSVTNIGSGAFSGCRGFPSITIPASVTSIGDDAFSGCSGLTSVHISDLAAWCEMSFGTDSSNPCSYAGHLFLNGTEITKLAIPDSVTNIGDNAFYGCGSISSVTIPASVTSIGDNAFYDCGSISSVTIPASVTSIGENAFFNCSGLVSVTIPNSVTVIGSSAFAGCSQLTLVAVPQCISNLAETFPAAYQTLANVTIANGVTNISSGFFAGCAGLAEVSMPNSIEAIGANAFSGCSNFSRLDITDVGEWAQVSFAGPLGTSYDLYVNNSIMRELRIPANALFISDWAFAGCASLEEVVLPEGLRTIGRGAFQGCGNLSSMTLPSTITCLGDLDLRGVEIVGSEWIDGFRICNGWVLGYEDETVSRLEIPEGMIGIAPYAFADFWDMEEVVMPQSLKYIGWGAFMNDTYLDNVAIPDYVEYIDGESFMGCTYLRDLAIGADVETIGERAFANCTQLTTLTIPNGVREIEECAFSNCWRMLSVKLPLNLETIGGNLFAQCSSLVGVTVPSERFTMAELLGERCGNITSAAIVSGSTTIRANAFVGCSLLEAVDIPAGVTNIQQAAFKNCSSLASPSLPETVESMGAQAFYGCTGLAAIVLPDSVRTIGAEAFRGCSRLQNATLSRNLASLPEYAFYGCSRLSSMVVPASVASLGSNIANYITSLYFLGNAPQYDASAYSSMPSAMTTYVVQGSRGWDGIPSSRDLPEKWIGRNITFWTPNRFTATFDANGGLFPDNAATYACEEITDTAYAIPPFEPTRAGHAFAGWWTDASAGAQIKATTRVVETRDTTFFAHWTLVSLPITVRFNANGGMVDPAEATYFAGLTYAMLPVPTREHYEFAGWFTQANGGVRVEVSSEVPGAGQELFAHWTPATYLIRYNANGGSGSMADQSFTYGDSVTLRANAFWLQGRSFIGWALSSEGPVAYADQAQIPTIGAVQGDAINLYAQWTAAHYAVRYDSNGGTGVMTNDTFTIGDTAMLTRNSFTRAGYVFIGWAATADGAVAYGDCEEVNNLSGVGDSTVSIFAVWARNASNVTLAMGGDSPWHPAGFARNGEVVWQSGAIGDGQTSSMTAGVTGSGTISFEWLSSCEPSFRGMRLDYLVFLVDGVEKTFVNGNSNWENVSVDINGAGSHAMEWRYVKDSEGAAYEDLGRVCAIVWTPDLQTLESFVNATNLSFSTTQAAPWLGQREVSHDGVAALQSGAISDGEETRLSCEVNGAGTLSFWWKVSCEAPFRGIPLDYASFELDGVRQSWLAGETNWTNVVLSIEGEGKHTFIWVYCKDEWEGTSAGDDCAWLDEVTWTPSGSAATEAIAVNGISVPLSWLDRYPTLLAEHGGSYAAAANALAANGRPVADCYVAGLCPTNSAARFEARIEFVDGRPVVKWSPDLNEGGTKHERVYTVEGRESLTDGDWGPTNAASRFFRVKVGMP